MITRPSTDRPMSGWGLDGSPWLTVKNESGQEIPPHAPMKLFGWDADGNARVIRPDKDDLEPWLILFNGDVAITAGEHGQGSWAPVSRSAYAGAMGSGSGGSGSEDSGTGPGAVGGNYGTAAGQWKLRKEKQGFLWIGRETGGTALFCRGARWMVEARCAGEEFGGLVEGTLSI